MDKLPSVILGSVNTSSGEIVVFLFNICSDVCSAV